MNVAKLWRYPVKSMLGEEVAESDVTERGLAGDRVRAVLDVATGRIASAKAPRLWRDLLTMEGARAPGDEELSRLLGREVRLIDVPPQGATLERSVPEEVLAGGIEAAVPYTVSKLGGAAPEGTFFDFAPIHLITTAAVERISTLSPRGRVEADRYRPNVVIATDEAGFPEDDWVGRKLHVGEEVELEILAPSPRCAVPTLTHGALPRDVEALRTLSTHHRIAVLDLDPLPCAGVYAHVTRSGRIRTGDPVHLS